MITKEEKLKRQREYRIKNKNSCTFKYEKTINGFLMRLYRNMTERVTGIQKQKYHLYGGKYLLSKEEFYNWSKKSIKFKKMFKIWEDSNYDRKLTPTVDRINSNEGYCLENMRWLTHSENSRLGALSKSRNYPLKKREKIIGRNQKGNLVRMGYLTANSSRRYLPNATSVPEANEEAMIYSAVLGCVQSNSSAIVCTSATEKAVLIALHPGFNQTGITICFFAIVL